MAVEEDTKDPFAPAAPTELLDPAHAALEENLAQVMTSLSTLTNCVSNVVPDAVEPNSHLPGGFVGHTINNIVTQLHNLKSCAQQLHTQVPVAALDLVDQNKNPDLHLKSFLEDAALENMYTNGLVSSVGDYRDELSKQLADYFPDLTQANQDSVQSVSAPPTARVE